MLLAPGGIAVSFAGRDKAPNLDPQQIYYVRDARDKKNEERKDILILGERDGPNKGKDKVRLVRESSSRFTKGPDRKPIQFSEIKKGDAVKVNTTSCYYWNGLEPGKMWQFECDIIEVNVQ